MRKYRNTKIVKSILLGVPVLFCSCYNNDSIKNGHCEDEKDFRYENGVVKIYDKPGKNGKFLKDVTVNEISNEKLNNSWLKLFMDLSKVSPEALWADCPFRNYFEDGRVFRCKDGVFQIYDKTGKLLKEVTVNEEQNKELKYIVKRFIAKEELNDRQNLLNAEEALEDLIKSFNAILEVLPEEKQQSILKNFDATKKVYKDVYDFAVEFCMALVKYEDERLTKKGWDEKERGKFLNAYIFNYFR